MKMKYPKVFFSLIIVCMVMTAPNCYADNIDRLQVNYTNTPIGIDENNPSFSWIMISDSYAARQTAYRLVIATSEADIAAGKYVYDSGRTTSGISVDVRASDINLKPKTRYYWQVTVWNDKNKTILSPVSWFETGLMNRQNWQNAEWIGSGKVNLSPYRTRFTIDYDCQLHKKSTQANFVLGAKSDKQYIIVGIDGVEHPKLLIGKVQNGVKMVVFEQSVDSIINKKNYRELHHIRIDANGPRSYSFRINIDGRQIRNAHPAPPSMFAPSDPFAFVVDNDTPDEPNPNSRLYMIGFQQPEGQDVTISNIKITENAYNTLLYSDPTQNHLVKGDGKVELWQPGEEISAPMLRRNVIINKPVASARLYATARGIYQFYINGRQIGKDYTNPGWTDYRKRIMYNTFDVTDALQQGTNGVGVEIGEGWYAGPLGFNTVWEDQYGVRPSVMALLEIRYQDGTSDYIKTDGTWKCFNGGPIKNDGLLSGEDYDARQDVAEWTSPTFDDSQWESAEIFERLTDSVEIQGYVGGTVQEVMILHPKSVTKVGNEYIYDFGQNFAGIPRLKNMKAPRGTQITIHYAEMLFPETIPTVPIAPYTVEFYQKMKGKMYRNNYRSALSTDRYTFKGDARGETFEPIFTQHGFRYLSIAGLEQPFALDQVEGVVQESIGDQHSYFETSNSDINQLFNNIVWGQRSNFLSLPTDCPQRDERMGWTGDAQVFSRAATYNMNTAAFYHRWLYSVRDNQVQSGSYSGYYPVTGIPPKGAQASDRDCYGGWQEAGVIVPWQVYQQYGDKKILEEHYASMAAFMDFLQKKATNYLQPFGGTADWLGRANTNSALSNTAYSAYAADIMASIATTLGHKEDAQRYTSFSKNVKEAFRKTFMREDGMSMLPADIARMVDPMAVMMGMAKEPHIEGNDPVEENTQTSYVLPLQFNMLNGTLKQRVAEKLHQAVADAGYTLTTGFIGTPGICTVLTDNGYNEDAYRLITQTEYPSWLFTVKQGATTMWERWNSYTKENGFGPDAMNSFNHYSYGAIEEWMISRCLGIERDEQHPGYKHFVLRPEPGKAFNYAKGGFESVYGKIESSWTRDGNTVTYRFTVPANTTATLLLPTAGRDVVEIGEGGKFVKQNKEVVAGKAVYALPSGTYTFIVTEKD